MVIVFAPFCVLIMVKTVNDVVYFYCNYKKIKGTTVKNFHKNGQLKSIGKMYKNKREGEWKFYDIDGKTLISVDNYRSGKKDGLSTDYYPKGQKKAEFYFKSGILNGEGKAYFENGNIQVETSWKNDVMDGEYKEYYQSGKIRIKAFLKNGKYQGSYSMYGEDNRYVYHFNCVDDVRKSCQTTYFDEKGTKLPDGPYEEYYKNGNMHRKGNIKSGFPDGKWCFYYEDSGALYREIEFEDGYEKSCFDYYPDGNIKKRAFLKNGIHEGNVEEYYQSGKVKEKYFMKNDFKEGKYKKFYENGIIEQEGQYQKNYKNGLWKFYTSDGKPSRKENYKINFISVKDGPYEEYWPSGSVKFRCIWIDGKREGVFQKFFENGVVEQTGEFHNDLIEGTLSVFYPNGTLKGKTTSLYGKADGPSEEYYENGQLKEKGNYKNDSKEGIWESYDKKGQLIKKEHYHKGIAHKLKV